MPDRQLEEDFSTRLGGGPIAGVDEVGRGPLAGPVITAAVIQPGGIHFDGLDDSKRLTARRREQLFHDLTRHAVYAVGAASRADIDRLNILHATMLAMVRSVTRLPQIPAGVLVDGNRIPPDMPFPAEAVVKGDGKSSSIAAASIIAKVTRDKIMGVLSDRYPTYGWNSNSGYPTAAHKSAILEHGITAHHRRTFRPVSDMFS